MKVIKGDLLKLGMDGRFDVIVHGCNCFHTMGSGIALQIKKTFPYAFEVDKKTIKGDKKKLGTYSVASIKINDNYLIILNAYTQYGYGGQNVNVDYTAIKNVFIKIAKDFNGLRIGFPKIGCGLAGGDWKKVSKIIDICLKGQDYTLCIL